MTEPLVSVPMITYNHAPFIVQAIEGVLQQKTNFPFELVIGEDCSTDGTRELVFEYQKKYPDIIRVITSDKNVGGRKNGRRTRDACKGKYIAFCEGDDYWHHPYKLQKQTDYLESHPECGMVFADCDVRNVKLDRYKRSFNYHNGYQLPINLSIEQIIWTDIVKWTCTVVARRELSIQIIERDPYIHKSGQFLMGDIQLWAEIASVSTVTYIPETYATYRVLDNSVSRSTDLRKHLRFQKCAAELKLYLCDKHKLSNDRRTLEELTWCNLSLRLAFLERNADLAKEVKKRKINFTWKEWLRYYGAQCSMIYYGCIAAILFAKLFEEENNKWP